MWQAKRISSFSIVSQKVPFCSRQQAADKATCAPHSNHQIKANSATNQVEMNTSQDSSNQSLAFKCIEFCSMLSNQGRRYAFSLKIENFNFSLKSDNNETSPRKRPRPPSYLKRQKLRASLQKEQQKKLSVKDVLEKNSDKDTKNEENRHFQWTPAPVNPTHSEQEREQKDNTEDNNKKNEKDDHTQKILKATVKPSPSEPERDPYELTIMIRKGKDRTDAPATGLGTYKLMSDWAQVSRVMNHFNLLDKISRV